MHAPPEASAPYAELDVGLANFYGMIANLDENVGRLRAFLRERDLAENTIFIFTTDNGTALGAKTYNAGMRGAKGSEYDGGHRVPFFLRWPAGELTGPRDIDHIAAHVDVFPTLLELCGLRRPRDLQFDGRSLAPLLRGDDDEWPDRILVTDSQRVKDPIKWRKSAVMTDRWRLINGEELYDMRKDPGQSSNVASGHRDVVRRLRTFYERWWYELKPTFSNDAAIFLGHPGESSVTLTSHDWITTKMTPWNQSQVRRGMRGAGNTGYWNVWVERAGRYRLRLRRWPPEVNVALDAGLPPGEDVPGQKAYRTTPGRALPITLATLSYGPYDKAVPVPSGAEEAVIEITMPGGPGKLEARFVTDDGEQYGAYYVVVERLEGNDD
jgi:arylsulfatase B